mgnify:CR=1 FL=1
MKSWENEVNEEVVADVKVPDQFEVKFINTILSKIGDTYEVGIKWGKKYWIIARGDLPSMEGKRDRTIRFIRDQFAPCPSSLEDFVEMARGV